MALLGPAKKTAGFALLAALAGVVQAGAEPAVIDEYQVKAAFLFNFAKFVEWPAVLFKGDEPLQICVLGHNPFGSSLENAVRGKTVAGRSVLIREITGVQQALRCQILFVASSERKRQRSTLDDLKGSCVLTVGESDDFIASGGVIRLKLKDDHVRIEIDTAAAERAKLRISSKLLSLAEISRK